MIIGIKLHPMEEPPKKNGRYVVWQFREHHPSVESIDFCNGKWNVSADDDSTEINFLDREWKVYWSEMPQTGAYND